MTEKLIEATTLDAGEPPSRYQSLDDILATNPSAETLDNLLRQRFPLMHGLGYVTAAGLLRRTELERQLSLQRAPAIGQAIIAVVV
jgi:hypothetical protein